MADPELIDPSTYDALIDQSGKDNNVDPALIKAVLHQESGFDPNAKGPMTAQGQALGIAQLMPRTAQALGVTNPRDPAQAIPAAAKLLAQNLDQYGNVPDAVSAYHGGTDQAQWGPKTQAYRNAVTAAYTGAQAGDLATAVFGSAKGAPATSSSPASASGTQPAAAPQDDLESAVFGAPQAKPEAPVTTRDTNEALTPAQLAVVKAGKVAGVYDAQGEPGSENLPYFVTPLRPDTSQLAAGSYFVTPDGKMNRVPGGTDLPRGESGNSFVAGLGRGVGDVVQSGGSLIPGHEDSNLFGGLKYDQLLYDANHPSSNLAADAGRFTGQVVGSAPVMAGVEGGLGLAGIPRLLGPVGTFLAGNAGKEAIPASASLLAKGGQLATRLTSLGAKGALQGGEAAAMTSSASDAPLPQQIAQGAEAGAVLGPLVHTVVGASGLGPKLTGGAPLADQVAAQDTAQSLPVPVNLTAGKLSGDPAQQMAESVMLKGTKGAAAQQIMQGAAQTTDDQLRANIPAIQTQMSGAPVEANEGGIAASNALSDLRAKAKAGVDANYDAARSVGNDAMLSSGADVRNGVLNSLSTNYTLSNIPRVAAEVENIGSGGAPTAQDLFDTRTRLSKLSQSGDPVEAGAARSAVKALDSHIDDALANDLFLGDPSAVDAWKTAIASRRDFGKAFEGDDFIQRLTEPTQHGGGTTLKVAPEDAANFIFGANNLGFTTKKNFTRDMEGLKNALGPDSPEWGALRAEAFARIARSAGPSDKPFSGDGFLTAWSKAKDTAPQALNVLFTPQEQGLIDNFANTAKLATSSVKGGDNPSNSGVYAVAAVKNLLGSLTGLVGTGGGAAIGSALGGPEGAATGAMVGRNAGNAIDGFFKDMANASKAKKAVAGLPSPPTQLGNGLRLLGRNAAIAATVPPVARLIGGVQPQPASAP